MLWWECNFAYENVGDRFAGLKRSGSYCGQMNKPFTFQSICLRSMYVCVFCSGAASGVGSGHYECADLSRKRINWIQLALLDTHTHINNNIIRFCRFLRLLCFRQCLERSLCCIEEISFWSFGQTIIWCVCQGAWQLPAAAPFKNPTKIRAKKCGRGTFGQ